MGNICRSPTAEAVFRHKATQRGLEDVFVIDSAGTHGYHEGAPPDARAAEAAAARGISLAGIRARRLVPEDLARFDRILTMDDANLEITRAMQVRHGGRATIEPMLLHSRHYPDVSEVPDPYYGGNHGFEMVLDLLEDACDGLLRTLDHEGRGPGAQ